MKNKRTTGQREYSGQLVFKHRSKKWVIERKPWKGNCQISPIKSKHLKMKDVPNPMHYNVKYLTITFSNARGEKRS